MGRVLAVFMAVCVLLGPSAAYAHGGLKSSTPAKGASLMAAPSEIRLVFSESAELAFTRVELAGPDGKIELGPVVFAAGDKRTVTAAVRGPLVAGPYTVNWQMAGADGHPVRGNYSFSIGRGATGLAVVQTTPAGGQVNAGKAIDTVGAGDAAVDRTAQVHHDPATFPDAGGFNAESPLYVVIRWLQFAAILVLAGAVAFQMFVLGSLRKKQSSDTPMLVSASQRAAQVGLYGAMALAVVAVTRLLAQSYAMHPPGTGFEPASMWSMIGLTTWGWGWILQATATVIAIAGFTSARKLPAGPGWKIAAVGAALGAFAPALSGHAASAPTLRPLAILADGIHIMGASGWLGSLLILLVAGIPAAMALATDDRGAAVADLVNAFSPTALVFAGLTATAGVFAGWLHVGTIPALWQTQYGQTLVVKLAFLGIVTATGAYNFLYLKPRLGTLDGVGNIRRSAMIEIGVAVVVLLVTAVLVATPTGMDKAGM